MDTETYIHTDRQTDRQTDRHTHRQTDRQTDGQTDGQTDKLRLSEIRAVQRQGPLVQGPGQSPLSGTFAGDPYIGAL